MRQTILIIEDDQDVRRLVERVLLDEGYSVASASDGVSGLSAIEKKRPDLALVDLTLPKLSGESVITEIRKKYPELPVMILTAKNEVGDIVKGFNLGADDYITKPFELDVLIARIKARLRHFGDNNRLTVDDLELDAKSFEVKRESRMITLSQKEFQLLEYLMANKGRVLTRDMILQRIWLSSDYIEPRVVDVYIGYLRKKIDLDHPKKLIRTMRGFGYTIRD